jgi:hypothetical protein
MWVRDAAGLPLPGISVTFTPGAGSLLTRPRSRPGDVLTVDCLRSAQGGSIAGKRYAGEYLGGLVAVTYLLGVFYAFALLRTVLPRIYWVTRLEHRWIGLWMR